MPGWEKNLDDFFAKTEKPDPEHEQGDEFGRFIVEVVVPAFEEVAAAMERHGRQANIRNTTVAASIMISHDGDEEMTYRVQGRMFPNGVRPYAEVRFRERKGHRYISVECMYRTERPGYSTSDIGREEIIKHLLDHYMRRVQQE